MKFKLDSAYKPTGDQPRAIEALTEGVEEGRDSQVLLGVTGSGKTFTMANVIEAVQKPTLILSHNKTLAHNRLVFQNAFGASACQASADKEQQQHQPLMYHHFRD